MSQGPAPVTRLVELLAVVECSPQSSTSAPAPALTSSGAHGKKYSVSIVRKFPANAVYKQLEHFCFPDLEHLQPRTRSRRLPLSLLSTGRVVPAPPSDLYMV